jgi:hypothetical protein
MRLDHVDRILYGSATGAFVLSALGVVAGSDEASVVFGGAGAACALVAVSGTVIRTATRPAPPAPKKPDYARIAFLEKEIFGKAFEHDGAPAHVHGYRWRDGTCQCGAFEPSWLGEGAPRPANTPPLPPRAAKDRPLVFPTPRPVITPPPLGGHVFFESRYGETSHVSIGGTASTGWSLISQGRAEMAASLPSPLLFDELKALMNFPRCPRCGQFSDGSTGRPALCPDCQSQAPRQP